MAGDSLVSGEVRDLAARRRSGRGIGAASGSGLAGNGSAPRHFGLVHRLVCAFEQVIDALLIAVKQADPHAGRGAIFILLKLIFIKIMKMPKRFFRKRSVFA